MSEVYRYEFDENGVCYRKPDGPFVSHDDYAAIHYERIHDLNHIGGLQEEIADLNAEVDALMTNPTSRLLRAEREENARLNNYIERLEVRNAVLVPENARLKAEVESLKKPAVIGGYNISEYIRMANSETLEFDNGDIFADMTLPERIKYIVESHARLKAEVERLMIFCNCTLIPNKELQAENARLKTEVERLTDAITRGASTPDARPE